MTSLKFSPRVPVFDANIQVGHQHDELSPCQNSAELLVEMDRHGVERALIYHAQADSVSPVDGNTYLEEWLAKDERLHPQWTVMPTPDSLAQVQALHAQGRVQCVRLHALDSAELPFRPWAYDTLLSWLNGVHIPVWISLPEVDPHELVTTLGTYPDLVSVLVGAKYTQALWVRPMLTALPNAFLELSRYESLGEVEAIRDEFGAQRLVYGSWFARYAMGTILFYLHHTSLSETDLALVCAGNLERILQGKGWHD